MPASRANTLRPPRAISAAGAIVLVVLVVMAYQAGRLLGPEAPTPTAAPSTGSVVPPAPYARLAAPGVTPASLASTPHVSRFVRPPVVCLDAGHGGPDRGFIRYADDGSVYLEEEPFVLEQARAVKSQLEQRGFQIVMTRETNSAVNAKGVDINGDGRTAAHDLPGSNRHEMIDELQARINICNAAGADVLVSLHLNGFSTSRPRGFETWFTRERPFGDRNARIATLIYSHLREQFTRIGYVIPVEEERGVLPDTTADVQKEDAIFAHFVLTGPEVPGIITPSAMPGVIAEPLFLSNDGDVEVLLSPEGRQAIIDAYVMAIVEYFGQFPPD